MFKEITGILLLDKPTNITSNGALQKVKKLFNAKKAGHAGSLDPIATGMLPIFFGKATKVSQNILESDKTYQVIAKLGEKTTTGDREGQIIETKTYAHLSEADIKAVLQSFIGQSSQIPPMFSALKHQGKPLYKFARQGIEIERAPRNITIHAIELNHFAGDTFSFTVSCTKGTYVRTLVEDIAQTLNTVAHVAELRRPFVVPFEKNTLFTLSALMKIAEETGEMGLDSCLLPTETALSSYPEVRLTSAAAFYIRTGQAVRAVSDIKNGLVKLMSEDGKFLGLGEATMDGRVKPHRMFV